VNDLEPKVQLKVAGLEDRPYPYRERLGAGVALVKAKTGRLTVQAADMLLGRPAKRAIGAVRPKVAFDIREGGFFVLEMGFGKYGFGRGNLL
jgi:hypothetical protein